MTSLLVADIAVLVTNDPAAGPGLLGEIRGAALVVEHGRVAWAGPAIAAPACDVRVSASGGAVLPGFVDSHTHLVFAGDRLADFTGRMSGRPYSPDGISSTVAATRAAPDEVLTANVARLLGELRAGGATTVEVKSGYGLTVADEARALAIARQFTDETTFLGAHVVPAEYAADRGAYVDLVTGPMLAAAAPHAKWIDVFCDRGAFDESEARAVCRAGMAAGLGPRLHGNQLGPGPGVRLAVELGAASVDHCTHLADADIEALAGSATVATLLPGAEFSTRSPYPDARRLLDAGVAVALATDCNPGTSYTTSIPLCIALAVREMGMSPAEAVHAATAGGARALRRDDIGVLRPGSRADFVVLAAPDPGYLAYRPGVPLVAGVWKDGRPI
ncbi:imidazolonepropionase [Sporichthya sp.]|uniref:imidazolonepropionase n=1 Tax=Sporichthya sp. TaxID=65475 RepID=UPI0017F5C0B5|nr:imidazolonepropionase [Sporichthya sp.]MBA3742074.1 imidazolonepropionase [Sporichthya sp.]